MNAYKVKCIALDLDNTTLDRNKDLPEKNRQALCEAVENGICIVIASGRPYAALPKDLLSLQGLKYAITGNGAIVCDVPNGKRIKESLLTESAVEKILKLTSAFSGSVECIYNGTAYAGVNYVADPASNGNTPESVRYVQATRKPVQDIRSFIWEHASQLDAINVIGPKGSERERLWLELEKLIPNIYVTASAQHVIEISSEESGKEKGLAWILKHIGITADETAAFGDGDNDAAMLASVGYGIAMENATELCKKAAKYHTLHFERCGVAYGIRTILKK